MKVSELINHLYWIYLFGRPKRKITSELLFAHPESIENPIFFLSTGRCGTEWFTHVIKKHKSTIVLHDPKPNLSVQNKFIHNLIQKDIDKELRNEVSKQILFAAREQHFRYAFKADKRYVETNNHITFFADTLATIFPSAKFIHLYRHPGGFVTSGLNRGWFDENSSATEKLITPLDQNTWNGFSKVEKISWVWNETNVFIEAIKNKYPDRVYSYDFSKRNVDLLMGLFQFLGIATNKAYLDKSLNIRRNVQQKTHFPSYENWNEEDKKSLKKICGDLCKKYNYEL